MTAPIETFRAESLENLELLEIALLELESDSEKQEFVDQAFRAIHTIKGAGGMFGFHELSRFTHYLESALEKLRAGEFKVSSELISVFLSAKDHIEDLLHEPEASANQKQSSETLLHQLYDILPTAEPVPAGNRAEPIQALEVAPATAFAIYRIRFSPDHEALRGGFDVKPILRELKALGDCHITSVTDSLPMFSGYDAEGCYLSWDITLVTSEPRATVEDSFIFVAEDWTVNIEEIDLTDTDEDSDRLGELLVERGLLSSEQLRSILERRPMLGEQLREPGLISETTLQAALTEQRVTRDRKKQLHQDSQDSSVRVPTARLDKLMNLVGELVIVQARMNQIAHVRDDEDIYSISEELELLTTEMRDSTFSIRMLPIGTTFGRFRRLVRDLSQELNKSINLTTTGAETELDKMMIDKLADPLVHLIRNSIDHGIEAPDERAVAGKSTEGNIVLSAEHCDSQVIISIQDDGRGLDTQAIENKARDQGLVQESDQLSEEQIWQLIFEPGFSTAEVVSDISGRGVGMDVVRRSIQELGGKLRIESDLGKGTKLTIVLPLTLAIIEGLLVRVAEDFYVLPLSIVEECVEYVNEKGSVQGRKRLLRVRGALVPYMRLREWFSMSGQPPSIEQIVVTRVGDEHFGFCVDEVVGQYQTVIKRLGKMYEHSVGFSGATILGDGSVAMILDAIALRDVAESSNDRLERAS